MAQSEWEDISGNGGVLKQVVTPGNGAIPVDGQTAWVHYTGSHKGQEFDSSRPKPHRRNGFDLKLGAKQVIEGWEVAIKTMKLGERANVKLQPEYGYGAEGTPGGPIPPNAVLDFDIELLRIT